MKILVVAPYPPTPPLAGGRRRIFEMLHELSRRNTVELACTTFSTTDDKELQNLSLPGVVRFGIRQKNPRLRDRGSVTGVHLVDSMWNEDLRQWVHQLTKTRRYDWIIAEHSYAVPYILLASCKKALTAHNIEYRLYEQLAGAEQYQDEACKLSGNAGQLFLTDEGESRRLKSFEEEAWASVDVCAVVSPVEQQIVGDLVGINRTFLVPNCPGTRLSTATPTHPPQRLVFIGALNYFPNVDAALILLREIFPRVKRNFPHIKLFIAGRDPEKQFKDICREENAVVVANPINIEALLDANSILVCPLRFGAGTRIKILDAMAIGSPIVASSVAAEGLGLTDGKEILIADNPTDFCNSVEKLLYSKSLRTLLSRGGREFVERNNLNWAEVFEIFGNTLRTECENL